MMTRDQAIQYLADQYAALLAECAIPPDSDGLDSVIDKALRWQSVAERDLATAAVADADVVDFLKLLDLAALQKLAVAATPFVNTSMSVSSPSVSKSVSRQGIVQNINGLLTKAELAAAPLLDGGAFTTGTVSLGAFGDCSWQF